MRSPVCGSAKAVSAAGVVFFCGGTERRSSRGGRTAESFSFAQRWRVLCGCPRNSSAPRPSPRLRFDVAKPTAAEQKTAWRAALGDNGQDNAASLAGQFNLNLPTIYQLSRVTKTEANDSNALLAGNIWEACCASERPRLDRLAQRLVPKVTWDDLVLPAEEMNRLKEIAAQVKHRNQVYCEWGFERKMNRGFSISALFAGDSGTGKTMAAEVIANELRLNLYRIDLSAVVNKYIGETEKNLRRLFDAAEDGGAILFFDEADALFGKRSEVKDSHDRYANIEINYLLQRIESYRGLAILATNMKSALDTAFMRRLRFIVNFPYPTAADRRRLWKKVFLQSDAKKNLAVPPLDELDYDRLAKLNLTGGHIHSAALNAAFRAAAEGSNVTMRLVLDAVRTELLKLDRPVNEADFRWTEPASDGFEVGGRNRRAAVRMNINLYIERLMLDGLSVASGEAALVQAAVEAELVVNFDNHPHTFTVHVKQDSGNGSGFVDVPDGTKVTVTLTDSDGATRKAPPPTPARTQARSRACARLRSPRPRRGRSPATRRSPSPSAASVSRARRTAKGRTAATPSSTSFPARSSGSRTTTPAACWAGPRSRSADHELRPGPGSQRRHHRCLLRHPRQQRERR